MQHQDPNQRVQQQPQSRGSFYRANRPGNLNIVENNVEVDLLGCHLGQAHPLSCPPVPANAHYSSAQLAARSVNAGYSTPNYTTANYGHQQQQQQHQQQSTYIQQQPQQQQQQQQQNTYTPSYAPAQQSYTPKYSPIASSAHLINKQAQYFNFDVSQVPQPLSTTNINVAASNANSSQQMYHPHSPHVLVSPRYAPQQPQQPQQQPQPPPPPPPLPPLPPPQQQAFNTNAYPNLVHTNHYNNMPRTPTSAVLPYATTATHHHQQTSLSQNNSMSVPSSPIHHHHMLQQRPQQQQQQQQQTQHSMFQFNTNLSNSLQSTISQQQAQSTSANGFNSQFAQSNTTNNFVAPTNDPQPDTTSTALILEDVVVDATNADSYIVSADQVPDLDIVESSLKPEDANDTTSSRVTTNVSKSANTNNNRTNRNDETSRNTSGGGGGGETEQSNVDLVTTKTYGENDVDMVQEVINDMIQQESIINNKSSSTGSLMDSSSDSRVAGDTPQRAEPQQASGDDMMMASGATDLSSAATATSTAPVAPIDIKPVDNSQMATGNQARMQPDSSAIAAATAASKKTSLENLTSVANILLNTSISENEAAKTSTAVPSNLLSNLSEAASAASAAFLLNYVQQSGGGMPDTNKSSSSVSSRTKAEPLMSSHQQQVDVAIKSRTLMNSSESNKQHHSSKTSFSSSGIENQQREHSSSPAPSAKKLNSTATKQQDSLQSMRYNSPASFYDMPPHHIHSPHSNLSAEEHQLMQGFGASASSGGGGAQNCPDCGKSFTNKSALAKHRLIHSNERKYACHLCDKSFKRQDHLNGHLQTHQDRKPFVCKAPGCDKSYCDSRSLKRHVESQHQDYLALLANGNQEALNYLPSIGKIKANVAPNVQHEFILNKPQEAADPEASSDTSVLPIVVNVVPAEEPGKAVQKAKNFFTFEEPKPEKCKICGKGFKNIPALNGHMRLHGGFLKQMGGSGSSGKGGGQNSNDATDIMNSSMNNEDSVSSNCSSNNSFSSANLNTFPHSNQSSSSKSYSKPHQQQQLNAAAAVAAAAAAAAAAVTGQNHSMSSSNLLYPNSIENGRRVSGDENSGLDSLYFGGGPSKKQQTLGANKSAHIQAANKQQAHQQHQQVNQQQSYRKQQQQQQQQQHQYQIDNNNNMMDNPQQYAMNMHQNKFKKETYEAPATDYSTQNNPLNFNSLMEMANNQAAKFPTGSSAYHVAPTYYRENGPVQQQQPQYQVPTAANSIVNSSSKKSSSSLSTSSMKINKISNNNNNDYENSSSSCSPPKFISNILQQQQQQQHHQKQLHPHHQPYQNEAAYQQQPQSQSYMMSGHLHQKTTSGQYQQYQQQSQAQSYQHQPVHGKQGLSSSSSNELALKSGSTAATSRHTNHGYMEVEGLDGNPQSSGVNQTDYYDRDEPENLAMNRGKPSGSENGFSRNDDSDETARNDLNKVSSNSNMDMAGSNASTINQISKHIYNFTQYFNQQAAAAAAVAAVAASSVSNKLQQQLNDSTTAAVVAAAVRQQQQQQQQQSHTTSPSQTSSSSSNNQNNNKQKFKPMPLVIPSDISAFQQQQQQKNQLSQSMGANMLQRSLTTQYSQSGAPMAFNHVYPHATLLKSPRLLNNFQDAKKHPQYTPPPMLSPFRKAPGLFYNPKHFPGLFSMPSPKQPQFNHSLSYSYFYPTLFYNQLAAAAAAASSYSSQHQQQQQQQEDEQHHLDDYRHDEESNSRVEEINKHEDENSREVRQRDEGPEKEKDEEEKTDETRREEEEEEEEKSAKKIIEESLAPAATAAKPPPLIHSKSRLLSQTSNGNNHNGAFFPDENEALHAALIDCVDLNTNTKPFINVGEEYQAVLPETRDRCSESSDEELELENREDVMWSCDLVDLIDESQFSDYLDLICKSSVVYGSSNNLELGLHILNYYQGNVKLAIKAFLDDSIDLPVNHPISSYKYNETDIWTPGEIKKFETAILKHDKVFWEIAKEVASKTAKQCIEFYYLWKKVMSDSARKKWRTFKKNRLLDDADSIEMNLRSSTAANNADNNNNNNKTEDENGKVANNNNENEDENELNNENECDKPTNDELNASPPSVSNSTQKQCDKCNMVFKTKSKLKQHLALSHA